VIVRSDKIPMRPSLIGILVTIISLMAVGPVLQADEPEAAPAERSYSSFSLKDLGEKDIVVKTIFDQVNVTFPLTEGRQIRQAVLKLHLAHGQQLLPESSDLTIGLNDEPVANLILTPENAAANFIVLPLPIEAFQPGSNHLTFRFNQRLHRQGCQDMNDPGLWTQIGSNSTIELDSVAVPIDPDLKRFPAPFDTLTTLDKSLQLSLILPPQPTSVELTAAGQIAAALGQAAQWENPPLHGLTADQLQPEQVTDHHLIVIDSRQRNPLAKGVEAGLTERISPYNPSRLMLVVSAPDEASLQQTADMLATQSARITLRGTHMPAMPITPQPALSKPAHVSLADLGFEDERVRGLGPHDLYYPIDIPYDWKITSEASIEIHFTHAPKLAEAKSRLSVFINGLKATNVPLTEHNDTTGRVVIPLSPRQIHPGRNWLHLLFELHLADQDCNFRYLQEAWAGVSTAASTVHLAHVESEPPLDLGDFPSPLLTPADLSKNLFILPDTPTQADLTALLRVAAKLGTYTPADAVRPQVITASDFKAALAPAKHVIAIGQPETNRFLATYNSRLPLSLPQAAGDNKTAATDQTGYIQILPAPWSRQASLMIISAVDDNMLARAVDVLPTLGQRFKVQGRVAIVTADQVKGLNTGVPQLERVERETLSIILLGAFAMIGSIGWLVRRQPSKKQEIEDANN
jgi:hypothetical protein